MEAAPGTLPAQGPCARSSGGRSCLSGRRAGRRRRCPSPKTATGTPITCNNSRSSGGSNPRAAGEGVAGKTAWEIVLITQDRKKPFATRSHDDGNDDRGKDHTDPLRTKVDRDLHTGKE